MDCAEVTFTRHAFEQMFARDIPPADVRIVVEKGEVVQEYPADEPYPSFLILAFVRGRALHIVVARDPATMRCYIVTVYEPDPARWESDFRTRKDGPK